MVDNMTSGCSERAGHDLADWEYLRKIKNHPCYDSEARHDFGRIHLPVAPKCNIQCNYCIRDYDCVHETRPGVTTEILSPLEALAKLKEVEKSHPWIKVVGFAGPGDPLANAETFETLGLIRAEYPYLKLCLSTNGLLLPKYIDFLKEKGVSHLTVTLNAVDPDIGKEIYSYVQWEGEIQRGLSGAKILLRQQLEGIRKAIREGIIVKINSVLIPTVNDHHLMDVAIKARELGATTMNIIPLISQYKFSHLKPPSQEERRRIQEACGTVITQMRHCRQCRADAVGKLGNDVDQRLPKPKKERKPATKIAVASNEGSKTVDLHFGHAKGFLIYRAENGSIEFLEARGVEAPYCTGPECDDPEDILSKIIALLKDCQYLICRRIGTIPAKRLKEAGIEPVEDFDYIERAIEKILTTDV
jgi:nitrogen fixation protein NifB